MMEKIREKVYETNSSSVHTLAMSSLGKEGLEPSRLPVDKDGYIIGQFGEFGKNLHYYETQKDKLSYLLTSCLYYDNVWDITRDDYGLYDSSSFHTLEETICDYTGAKGIKVDSGQPDIDHQSIPGTIHEMIIDVYDKEAVINFIFNKYVALKTDCD